MNDLKQYLENHLHQNIELKINRNRSVFVSMEKKQNEMKLSLHESFLQAPEEVKEALVSFIRKKGKNNLKTLREYFDFSIKKYQVPMPLLQMKGDVYDLEKMFIDINERYFDNQFNHLKITYFQVPKYKSYRQITYGTFDAKRNLVRINRLLDNIFFTYEFVSFIVFHEILHAVYPTKLLPSGRYQIHSPQFRQHEKTFKGYNDIKLWEKNNMKRFFERVRRTSYGRT
ncbi:MAG TPA: hypothetical protein P5048_02165 [Chlamydiales bacterium]|nr:hypothetical protein [Chlamydiales bacterium]